MTPTDEMQLARDLAALLDEVTWRYGGGQSPEGYCCQDVSYIEYRALRHLAEADYCTVQEIGKNLGITKSGATRIVDRLERKGYASRQKDAADHRVCCVALTQAGRTLVESIVEESARRTAASLARLDSNMRAVLLASLRAFVQTFPR